MCLFVVRVEELRGLVKQGTPLEAAVLAGYREVVPPRRGMFMGKTILHADDSPAVRRWVADHLSGLEGVKVVSVSDGAAALKALQKSPCDLLLTDLEMPELDGFALVAAVREMPMYRFLPILVLSSRSPTEVEPEKRQGVTGWIVKPAVPEDLRRWVRRTLPR